MNTVPMNKAKTIGIIGTRRRNNLADYYLVRSAFYKLYEAGDRIVSGGCPKGGDRFAELIAISLSKNISPEHLFTFTLSERHALIKQLDAHFILHLAKWDELGKSAGFQRNTLIARDADVLIACVAPDRKGGTEDTITKYLALGKTDLILVD